MPLQKQQQDPALLARNLAELNGWSGFGKRAVDVWQWSVSDT